MSDNPYQVFDTFTIAYNTCTCCGRELTTDAAVCADCEVELLNHINQARHKRAAQARGAEPMSAGEDAPETFDCEDELLRLARHVMELIRFGMGTPQTLLKHADRVYDELDRRRKSSAEEPSR